MYRVTVGTATLHDGGDVVHSARPLLAGTYRWDVRTVSEDGRVGSRAPRCQPAHVHAARTLPQCLMSYLSSPPTPRRPRSRRPIASRPCAGPRSPAPTTTRSGCVRRARSAGSRSAPSSCFPAGEDLSTDFLSPGELRVGGRRLPSGQHHEVRVIRNLRDPQAASGPGRQLPGRTDRQRPARQRGNAHRRRAMPACRRPARTCGRPQSSAGRRPTPTSATTSCASPATPSSPTWSISPIKVSSTMWVDTAALPDSQAATGYFWAVVPCTAAGYCSPPEHATHAFNKTSRAATLVSPADNAVVQDDVTLTWRRLPRQPEGRRRQRPGHGHSSRHARRDRGPPVPGPDVDRPHLHQQRHDIDRVDQRTFTSFSRTYPEGTNYWRVQAIDGIGQPAGLERDP